MGTPLGPPGGEYGQGPQAPSGQGPQTPQEQGPPAPQEQGPPAPQEQGPWAPPGPGPQDQGQAPYGQGPPGPQGPSGQGPQGPYGQGAPGPYGPPAAAPRVKVRPGRIWYLVPLLVLLGGVAWLVLGLVSLSSQIDSFPRVPLPAGGQISLDHTGGYTVYYEGPGASSGHIPAFRVRVVPVSPGASVTSLAPYNGSVTYVIGSHEGRAVLTMQVAGAGRFAVQIPEGSGLAAGSYLAFGSGVVGGIVGTAVPSGLLILLGFAGLVVLLIVRIVQTSRARTAARAPLPPPSTPYQPT